MNLYKKPLSIYLKSFVSIQNTAFIQERDINSENPVCICIFNVKRASACEHLMKNKNDHNYIALFKILYTCFFFFYNCYFYITSEIVK